MKDTKGPVEPMKPLPVPPAKMEAVSEPALEDPEQGRTTQPAVPVAGESTPPNNYWKTFDCIIRT